MLSQVFSAGLLGIDAYPVEIEVDVADGLPQEVVVGLPDAAVKESKDRVHAALLNSGFRYPDDRITINLAPADIKKEGPSFDLPIALGMLKASSQLVREDLSGFLAVGELALNGAVRPVKGILSIALMAKEKGGKTLLVPAANGPEAAIVEGLEVRGVESLSQVIQFLEGRLELPPVKVNREELFRSSSAYEIDFADVKGQEHVKRALEVSVAGGHNILLIGPPGSGKSMLAHRIPTILPPMTLEEALETTRIHSSVGLLPSGRPIMATRPFYSPHHTISDIVLSQWGGRKAA